MKIDYSESESVDPIALIPLQASFVDGCPSEDTRPTKCQMGPSSPRRNEPVVTDGREKDPDGVLAGLEAVWQIMAEGIALVLPDGTIAFLNRHAEEILKISEDECQHAAVRFENIAVFESADGVSIRPEEMPHLRALRGESTSRVVLTMRPPDGVTTRIAIRACPIAIPGRFSRGAIVAFSDMSEQWKNAREQQQTFRSLSHALRTPLAVIVLQVGAIEKLGVSAQDSLERLRVIMHCAEQMSEMLRKAVAAQQEFPPMSAASSHDTQMRGPESRCSYRVGGE